MLLLMDGRTPHTQTMRLGSWHTRLHGRRSAHVKLIHVAQPGAEVGVVRDAPAAALEQRRICCVKAHYGGVQPQVGLCEPASQLLRLVSQQALGHVCNSGCSDSMSRPYKTTIEFSDAQHYYNTSGSTCCDTRHCVRRQQITRIQATIRGHVHFAGQQHKGWGGAPVADQEAVAGQARLERVQRGVQLLLREVVRGLAGRKARLVRAVVHLLAAAMDLRSSLHAQARIEPQRPTYAATTRTLPEIQPPCASSNRATPPNMCGKAYILTRQGCCSGDLIRMLYHTLYGHQSSHSTPCVVQEHVSSHNSKACQVGPL